MAAETLKLRALSENITKYYAMWSVCIHHQLTAKQTEGGL
jgi:hypothetical protein